MELVQSPTSMTLIDRWARTLVLGLLPRLEQGHLLLRDGERQFSFGEPAAELQCELVVHDPGFYRRLLLGAVSPPGRPGLKGSGPADPVALVRLLVRNMALLDKLERRLSWLSFPFNKVRHWVNRNTLTGSRSTLRLTTIWAIGSIRAFSIARCNIRALSIPTRRRAWRWRRRPSCAPSASGWRWARMIICWKSAPAGGSPSMPPAIMAAG